MEGAVGFVGGFDRIDRGWQLHGRGGWWDWESSLLPNQGLFSAL